MEAKKCNEESEIDLIKLRNRLPSGYSKILQKRIEKKYGKTYVLQSIRRGLTNGHKNQLIIEEAIRLAEELENNRLKSIHRINKL